MKVKNLALLALLAIISLLPFWQWLDFQIPQTHDIILQVARIASFTQGIREGSAFPRWGGNLNNGYGHPSLMFLYPLTSYLGAFFSLAGLSYVWAAKLTFMFLAMATAIGMYVFLLNVFNRRSAFWGTFIYLLFPYRLVDINVRGALGELAGWAVFPWLMWRFHELVKIPSGKNVGWAGLALALMILAHNALGIMGIGLLIIWLVIYLWKESKERRKRAVGVALAVVLGVGLSAFYLIPGLLEGKYTFQKYFTSFEIYKSRFPKVWELIYSSWGYGATADSGRPSGFTVSIGLANIVLALIGMGILLRNKKIVFQQKSLITAAAGACILSFYLLTPFSIPLVKNIGLIHRFQFPWRWLALSAMSVSILGGWTMDKIWMDKKRRWVGIALSLVIIIQAVPGFFIQGYDDLNPANSAFEGSVEWTTDTGESTPRWTLRFQDWPAKAPMEIVSTDGKVEIEYLGRSFIKHEFIVTSDAGAQMADNTLYFPGWKVYVNGEEVSINFQDQNWRGLITFPVPAGKNKVEVIFKNTKIRTAGEILTGASFLIWMALLVYPLIRKKR